MIDPPEAPRKEHTISVHGESWDDPYFWLRDKENPETINYLEKENAYTEEQMAHTEVLQDELFGEMKARINETDQGVPTSEGGYLYYWRTEAGKNYRIYCRKLDMEGSPEEIMLDVNQLAEGKKFTSIASLKVSPDHRLLAYSVDHSGYETYEIHIKNLMTNREYDYTIENTGGSLQWATNSTLYYNTRDDIHRSYRIHFHTLHAPDADEVIKEEENTEKSLWMFKSTDNRYLFVNSTGRETDQIFYIDIESEPKTPVMFNEIMEDVEFDVDHHQGHFYFLTSKDAKNFRMCRVAVGKGMEDWVELMPHNPKIRLLSLQMFRDFGAVHYRMNGLTNVRVFNLPDFDDHTIELPESLHVVYLGDNPNFRATHLRLSYSSPVTPNTVYDYDPKSRELTERKVEEVEGYDASQFVAERKQIAARDGTMIPVSIAYKRGSPRPGPLLLYGYGSYGISTEPNFNSIRLSLLERGVTFVMAHIRGGGEMGKEWYHAGKMKKKMNTFTDFIDVAQGLLRAGLTTSDKMSIMGGSAGGLLVGAVVNMRPDLFKSVVAVVPFVDVISTMLDETIPLTTFEFKEWGNPKIEDEFRYMMRYSPYDQVGSVSTDYPDMLITAGLNDPRVHYWEPAKWCAKLRDIKTDSNKLLLKTNMGAGHAGASGRYERLREQAFNYAFVLDSLNLTM